MHGSEGAAILGDVSAMLIFVLLLIINHLFQAVAHGWVVLVTKE